jgi:hypothetical protein
MRKLTLPLLFLLLSSLAWAEGPLEGLKQSLAHNKQALAQYTWQETQTLSLDGEVKRTTVSSVVLDASGQPQKTTLSEQSAPEKEVKGPLRKRLKERKTGEFKDYMQQVGQLAQSYSQPDPSRLQEAFKAGNVTIDSSGGPSQMRLTVKNYLKPNDILVLVFDQKAGHIKSVQVNSYLDSPDNAVELDCTFAQLPDGTNHLDQSTLVGEEKEVTVVTKNSDYKKKS